LHDLTLSKPKQSDPIAVKEKFIHAKVLHSLLLFSTSNFQQTIIISRIMISNDIMILYVPSGVA
jgi:hypothetical protein